MKTRFLRPQIKAMSFRLTLSVTLLLVSASARADFTPIPLGATASRALSTIDPSYPTGNLSFLGIPFVIPAIGNNVVWNNDGPLTGTIITDVPVGVAGVTQVHTLLNTTFGQPGPSSYLSLEFFGSDGANYAVSLIGNEDVRDLNDGYGRTLSTKQLQKMYSSLE
ncbi:MAG: hypothetical protein L0Z50_12010 [Verrucomicrobiales bacterium]|nr:hypothetical protein [Verrucomicrobiales bacterium]